MTFEDSSAQWCPATDQNRVGLLVQKHPDAVTSKVLEHDPHVLGYYPAMGSEPPGATLTELVDQALNGSDAAWSKLVDRLENLVWKAVNMVTSDPSLREEAAAATWLAFARGLSSIRDPEYLPGWLSTTATKETLSLIRRESRHKSDPFDSLAESNVRIIGKQSWDEDELDDDERALVRAAFQRLKPLCRQLLTVLVLSEESVSYAEVASSLDLPIGALGPTRRRCLEQLRNSPEIVRVTRLRS
jgi:RNA polymerase sigma factor (sigma-70 family)